jgi:uncharacterized membrane protein YhaH (DUF805 family)
MSVVREVCPSCAAPLDIPANTARIKCPYCSTSLAIERHGSEVALAMSDKIVTSIEKTGTQTHEAIKEGSYVTQTELRRLQVAQDLSMVQMRLSNIQGEIRSIERLPASSVTRNQLRELRANESDLKRQAQTLTDILNPPSPTSTRTAVTTKKATAKIGGGRLGWLLFSTTGRASRGQYWLGIFIVFIIFVIASSLSPSSVNPVTGETTSSVGFISGLFMLLFFWTGFAVSAKRYHDRGKPAWWVLIILIPIIGFLWQLIELGFFPGNPEINKYS